MRRELKMLGFTLGFLYYVAGLVTSHQIKVECEDYYVFPSTSVNPPSTVADLNLNLVREGEKDLLNISWAINVDASINSLTSTWLDISGEPSQNCQYSPSFTEADLTGFEQVWFNVLVKVTPGFYRIEVQNVPLPPLGSGPTSKVAQIFVQRRATVASVTSTMSLNRIAVESTTEPPPPYLRIKNVTVIIFGLLATLTILCSCYAIYKMCEHKPALPLCFNNQPAPPIVPVSVLVVYPAKDSAFQRVVMVLAEILQLHGGCTVAIDMWQQEKIAELGPMRWLAEQAKGAHCVIIVSPQVESASSLPSHSLPNHSLPELSIPAAAHDLYPLILNMVAGHAKSTSELAKFWVVQLSEQKDRHSLPPELRSCKTFCLMKDLKKLCKSLNAHRQGEKKILDLLFRPRIFYSENSTMKLKEAIGQLRGDEPSRPREMQPLKCDFNLV
ncbi:uncharacterized protein [Leuresthes tenuis]|uniref:uncharacterized protein n=1 Tax=Leuresthes tenuis TaxID=355514 RepID=UPI003B514F35